MRRLRRLPGRNRLELMVQVAELYYEHGQTQQQIADFMGVSRSAVSRLLAAAADEGVVRIQVVNPLSRAQEMAGEVRSALGLEEVVVVPSAVPHPEVAVMKVARAAASYLVDHLRPGQLLGVGRGRTVYETVRALPSVPRLRVDTVPLVGGMGEADAHFQVNELARLAAERLGGRCWHLYAPAILRDRRVKDSLLQDSRIREVAACWDRLDWALVGIGSVMDPANEFYLRAITRFRTSAGRDRVVGDVCLWFLEEDGTVPVTAGAERVVGVTPEQLRRTPRVLGVAGGLRKASAVVAAARAGLIKSLVTDEVAAEAILEKVTGSARGKA